MLLRPAECTSSTRWDENAGLRGMRYAPKERTIQSFSNQILKEQKLTIGMDLRDRWSFYCILDEAGKILLEQKVPTIPEGMKETFARLPQSLIALETGTHSAWASRLSTELGHEVIVAHAQKVELITKSNRKADRHDERALARWHELIPSCWDQCGIVVRKRKST